MKIKERMELTLAGLIRAACNVYGARQAAKLLFGLALLAAWTGCVGYVDGGYGGGVVVAGPDVSIFGGGFERGRDVHAYSQRGGASRAVAHSGGGARGGRR